MLVKILNAFTEGKGGEKKERRKKFSEKSRYRAGDRNNALTLYISNKGGFFWVKQSFNAIVSVTLREGEECEKTIRGVEGEW